MGTMNVSYDAEGDTLYIQFLPPTGAIKTREIGDGILAHVKADSGAVEMVEVWNFLRRASSDEGVDIPVGDVSAASAIRAAS